MKVEVFKNRTYQLNGRDLPRLAVASSRYSDIMSLKATRRDALGTNEYHILLHVDFRACTGMGLYGLHEACDGWQMGNYSEIPFYQDCSQICHHLSITLAATNILMHTYMHACTGMYDSNYLSIYISI